jgi:predicted kinase
VSTRPKLVIVGGPPAAGKTTLVQTLSDKLGIPHFSRDEFKETLLTLIGAATPEQSEQISEISYVLMYETAERLLASKVGVVIESNFRQGEEEKRILPLLEDAEGYLIHCTAADKEIEERFIERAESGERHPGHFDEEGVPQLRRDLARDAYDPLELDIPTLIVNTADGYNPSLEKVVAFAREPQLER